MNAKEYLAQLQKLDRLIQNKQLEIDKWHDMAMGTSVGYTERVQSSGNQQKMADSICNYVDIQRELAETIGELIRTKQRIIEVIEQLPPIEYDLLHKHYVQGISLGEIPNIYDAENNPRTYSWVTTCHGRALQHVQRILDERAEGDV